MSRDQIKKAAAGFERGEFTDELDALLVSASNAIANRRDVFVQAANGEPEALHMLAEIGLRAMGFSEAEIAFGREQAALKIEAESE